MLTFPISAALLSDTASQMAICTEMWQTIVRVLVHHGLLGRAGAGRTCDLSGGLPWDHEEGVGLYSHASQDPALPKGL